VRLVPRGDPFAFSRAARNGVIVKGAGAIETLGEARTVLFDKTGTLTSALPTCRIAGALFQEVIDLAVILNALRALRG
jgi:P-type E1-E2 ATPase